MFSSTRSASAALDETAGLTAKILVLGDQSVGKTSLVHLLTERKVLAAPRWTVGCEPDVLLLPSTTTSGSAERVFVALFDVGGAPRFAESRALFYDAADALLLVHDLSNRRSYSNLRRWLREVAAHYGHAAPPRWSSDAAASVASDDDDATGGAAADGDEFDRQHAPIHVMQLDVGAGRPPLPVLVLGNKLDEVLASTRLDVEGGAADSVHVSAHDALAFAPGSVGGIAVSRLFERAVAHARARVAAASSSSSPALSSAPTTPLGRPSPYARSPPSASLFAALDSDDARIDDGKRGGGGGGGGSKGAKKD